MTEEEWRKIEGGIKRTEKFHFFVKTEKEQEFLSLLSQHHLENGVEEKRGKDGLSLFLIPLNGRKDCKEIRKLLNDKQPAFLH